MRYSAFPFSAVKGQEEMKMALLLNVIDPKIGGVLLTGQQGTGKTTAVRSLSEILPPIKVIKGCPFNCDPDAKFEDLCDVCKENHKIKENIYERTIPLVNLPLGVTEDMVVGSLDIERILSSGIKALNPGLLAKANRGILYIDEINLLQDHIIDILLDSSATGVNIIEREGISLVHPANFILVGSMNPEEGELRPQIQDRFGLEVTIISPTDPKVRAQITKDVIDFSDNPEEFLKKYEAEQNRLRDNLIKARELVKKIEIPNSIYIRVGELVRQAGVYSQRADISLMRCARVHAAFKQRSKVEVEDFEVVFPLVFGHRMKNRLDVKDPEFYESEIKEILGKIKEAIEDPEKYKPNWEHNQDTLKYSEDSQKEYKENPLDENNMDIPEWNDDGGGSSKNRFTDQQKDFEQPPGYKVGKTRKYIPAPKEMELNTEFAENVKKIDSIFRNFRRRKGHGSFSGRGNRAKILSEYKGAYLTFHDLQKRPKSIAFDATIKAFLSRQISTKGINNNSNNILLKQNNFMPNTLNRQNISRNLINPNVSVNENVNLSTSNSNLTEALNSEVGFDAMPFKVSYPLRLKKSDIKTKMFEYKAPLTIYFILDASASMIRSLQQTIEVVKSLHAEGYKKKDKVAVITFYNKDMFVLQEPSVSLTRALKKMQNLEAQSYTPLALALDKVLRMIKVESIKAKDNIPVIIICSDMGANISARYPDMEAKTVADFAIITEELRVLSKKIGQKKIKTIIMNPKKAYASRYLGIYPQAANEIIDDMKKYAGAEVFEFEIKNPSDTIIRLKRML